MVYTCTSKINLKADFYEIFEARAIFYKFMDQNFSVMDQKCEVLLLAYCMGWFIQTM